MTVVRSAWVCASMLLLTAPAVVAQTPPAPVVAASVAQRADALIGLGRVARDRGDWQQAHARFAESARLRAFDASLQEEHFWVAVQADRAAAMQLAAALATQQHASRDVFARWIALAEEVETTAALLAIVDKAALAVPGDPEWVNTRARVALRAERAADLDTAARTWATVPAAAREARADWQASFLRVSASRTGRAPLAQEFDRYVRAHPADAGMRAIAVEAWADAGQPARGLDLLTPWLGDGASPAHVRRAADLARQSGAAAAARVSFQRLRAMGAATDEDTWTLAMLIAAQRDSAALRALFATWHPAAERCSERLVAVATASGDNVLLSDLVPSLDTACPTYAVVAGAIAGVRLSQGQPAEAERWLSPLARTGQLDDASRLLLARALSARQDWSGVDALLAQMVTRRDDAHARAAAQVIVWAWQAQGRSAEAWALAKRLGTPFADTPSAQAGWATLALEAGDATSAVRLADAALGSSRDVDARMIHATLAAREGRPREVRRWLDPVRTSLTNPGHVAVYLDAIEAADGEIAARQAADAFAAIIAVDPGLLSRRATWAMSAGAGEAAMADAARVRRLDAGAGERLDVALLIAADRADSAWEKLAAVDPVSVSQAPAAWRRLRLDVALAAQRWTSAEEVLSDPGLDVAPPARTVAAARLRLGRDGTLDPDTRTALEQLIASDRQVRAARVLLARDDVARGAYAAALSRLSIGDAGPVNDDGRTRQLPADVRAIAAEALLGLGRAPEVLALISTSQSEPIGLQLARARARLAIGEVAAVRPVLEQLARTTGRADAYLAWIATLESVDARLAALRDGVARHPAHVELRLREADARRLAGDFDGARRQVLAVLVDAPTSRDAWAVRVAIEAASRSIDLVDVLREARVVLGGDAEVALLLGEAVAQAPQVSDAAVDEVARWIADMPATHQLRAARLEASLAVSAGRWPMAQSAIARMQQLAPPQDLTVLRLQAQVTAWSGEHAAAVPLFAAYLHRVPDDGAAWRQYARLLSWRDDREGAARAYARAEALAPVPGVAAEARTRLAILQRDWPDAVAAATTWRREEPAMLDALVDLALALEQSGDVAGAAVAYQDLARWPTLPDTVRHTLGAYEWRQASRGTGQVEVDYARGFGDQRLVERRETALLGDAALTRGGDVRAFARLGQGRLDTGSDDPSFTQAQAGLRAWFGRGVTAEGRLGTTRINGDAWLGGARLGVQLARHVAIEAATARTPFWENEATVAADIQAWTTGGRVRLLGSGALDASAGVDVTSLSDGNRRTQLDVSMSRQASRGRQVFELRASGFLFGFREARPMYFSPSAFGRADVEVGVQRWFGQGASVRDGRFTLRGRTGTGVDTDGVPYWLGGGSMVVPLTGPLALAGDARWTTARTYQAWSATVGVQVGVGRGEMAASRTR